MRQVFATIHAAHWAAILLWGAAFSSSSMAADYSSGSYAVTISDAIPRDEKIRGCVVLYFSTGAEDTREWLDLLEQERLCTVRSAPKPDEPLTRNARKYQGLIDAMTDIGDQAGRPELADVGFVFAGCSSGASHSMVFGLSNWRRTLAIILYHNHQRGRPTDALQPFSPRMPEFGVPVLYVWGGRDFSRLEPQLALTSDVRRNGRGLWTATIHPGARHCKGSREEFNVLWLREVLESRLPAVIPDGPFDHRVASDEQGWLGRWTSVERTTRPPFGSSGDPGNQMMGMEIVEASTLPDGEIGNYVWFPNERVARAWLNFNRHGSVEVPESP